MNERMKLLDRGDKRFAFPENGAQASCMRLWKSSGSERCHFLLELAFRPEPAQFRHEDVAAG